MPGSIQVFFRQFVVARCNPLRGYASFVDEEQVDAIPAKGVPPLSGRAVWECLPPETASEAYSAALLPA